MAITKCQECGKEISDKAQTCPHCGAPVEEGAVSSKTAQSLKSGGILLIILSIIMEYSGMAEISSIPQLFIYLMAVGVVMVIFGLINDQKNKRQHKEENQT